MTIPSGVLNPRKQRVSERPVDAGRFPIEDISPTVDGGAYPAKAVVGEHVPDTELMMAGSVLTVLPVLLLFLLLQKQYVEGITLGGVKE